MNRQRCLAALLVLLPAAAAQATTLARLDLDGLTAAAAVVARVRCVANETRAEAGAIWTLTTFEVREAWKGGPLARLTVRLPGGRLGRLTAHVEGVPRFTPGEEAVLFLEPTRAGDLTVTSWSQGTFRIRRDSAGRERVTQDTSGLAMFDPVARRVQPGGVQDLPLEELKERVARAVEQAPGRQP